MDLNLRVAAEPTSLQTPFNAVVTYEVVCNMIWREDSSYERGQMFASPMSHFTVQIANGRMFSTNDLFKYLFRNVNICESRPFIYGA